METPSTQSENDLVEVFRIHHKDIPKGITQCADHKWEKLSDNELYCPICESAIIVDPTKLENYV